MKEKETPGEIRKIAFRLLGRRDLSEAELKKKLEQKGFESASIKEVLTDLQEMGYINDRSLCERLAKYLAEERLLGNRRIEATLKNKGFPLPLVREAIANIRKEWPEEEALKEYLAKGKLKRVTADKLIYRGFSPSLVYELLNGRHHDEG
ncbi:MAG: recombination regulator RecX [Syntrophales bacterium]|nr:recombination regulator RecX [Syntrophales bacterium]